MRKFRSSITTLIIKARIGAAFSSFDAQYNFLRFTDVTEVCKEMTVWAAPDTMKVGDLSKAMAERKIVCAPVANAAGEAYGFVDMMDLCAFMLAKVASSFRCDRTPFQSRFFTKTILFYQDRLGTHVGKTLIREMRFLLQDPDDGPRSARHAAGQGLRREG